ncbi:MAG: D-alanyl-lipoteichoic acid biosynthesis protein DltB [Chloroflexi bacterium]|nr:D-alanyl-lipoteichoic acid biosynthesis protein DltB [Chloroflexota bacterium]
MTPYDSFTYFAFLLYPVLVIVALGLLRLQRPLAIFLVGTAMLLFQYLDPLGGPAVQSDGRRQLLFLAGYAVGGTLLVLLFAVARQRRKQRWLFYLAITLALLPLIVVKAYPLLAVRGVFGLVARLSIPQSGSQIGGATGLFDLVGFLGVSYMVFRLIGAIMSVQDGVVKGVPRPLDVLTYLTFLPTISAGPIDNIRRFTSDLRRLPLTRRDYVRCVEAGINRIAQGFLYKFVLAYLIYRYVLEPAKLMPGFGGELRYMYGYSLYLFFDFAGYSAFAIGCGCFFGIQVPENFNKPFLSRDFREMWNRWFMSLSFWLRDHVYMRFMLLAARKRWFGGNRTIANYAGLLLTFGLMGCWHGLQLHYIVYGLYQAVMMIAYDVVGRWNIRKRLLPLGWPADIVGWLCTTNLFCFGLLIFSGHLFV